MSSSEEPVGADLTQQLHPVAEPTPNQKHHKFPKIEMQYMDPDGTYIVFHCPDAHLDGYMIGARQMDVHVVEHVEGEEEPVDSVINAEPIEYFAAKTLLERVAFMRLRRQHAAGAAGHLATA